MSRSLFYRVHWKHNPPFSPENAQSEAWNLEYEGDTKNCPACKAEGRVPCAKCGGDGCVWIGPRADQRPTTCPACKGRRTAACGECGGKGAISDRVRRGYSAFTSADELVQYMDSMLAADASDPVVVFSGQQIGEGHDGEPLVLPDMQVVRWTTYGKLKKGIRANPKSSAPEMVDLLNEHGCRVRVPLAEATDQFAWHKKPADWSGAPCPVCGCPAKRLKAWHRAMRAGESKSGALWVKSVKTCFGTDSSIEPIYG